MSMNRETPAGMTIVDNRTKYINKEFDWRWSMPAKTKELASLIRQERYAKGHKFQMNLRIKRAVKERKAVIAMAKAMGITGSELQ